MPDSTDLSPLWSHLEAQFPLGESVKHGPDHWRAVERNGVALARKTGADVHVVRLFAAFHDSSRHNESRDPNHGDRAADLARALRGHLFECTDDQLSKLNLALRLHDRGQVSNDPTIGTCWDADRLELGRVNIKPRPKYLSTQAARRRAGGK